MKLNLHGMTVENVSQIIIKKFGKNNMEEYDSIPYQLYDGYIPNNNDCNTISIEDILITTAMNSNINASTLLNCWNSFLNSSNNAFKANTKRQNIEESLRKIPYNASLTDIKWLSWTEPLKIVFQELLAVPRIGTAVATKILHRKRPYLIPMWDSYLDSFFYWVSSTKNSEGTPQKVNGYYHGHYVRAKNETSPEEISKDLINGMKLFRETLVNPPVLQTITQVQNSFQKEGGYDLSPVRILESIIWWQLTEGQSSNLNTKEIVDQICTVYKYGKWIPMKP